MVEWGLLGPEMLGSTRRIRTLGISASVRRFNDLAVPGLAAVWYGKQLLLTTLGVKVAEQARIMGAKVQNIEVANAIEAAACLLAFNKNEWTPDLRMRGISKLRGKKNASTYREIKQRSFYVSQPMRMGTGQALPPLGFAHAPSARFNAFTCTEAGSIFVEEATYDYRPFNRTIVDHLARWVCEKDGQIHTDNIQKALSPVVAIRDRALPLLRERLLQGGSDEAEWCKQRRKLALAWVDEIRSTPPPQRLTWTNKPQAVTATHWDDLRAGAQFFELRDAAIALLDQLEDYIANLSTGPTCSLRSEVPACLAPFLYTLGIAARKFLEMERDDVEANAFARECADPSPVQVVRRLVERDGRVLRLTEDDVRPGVAFRQPRAPVAGGEQGDDDDAAEVLGKGEDFLPEYISRRVRNLYLLNLDLHGALDAWLKRQVEAQTYAS